MTTDETPTLKITPDVLAAARAQAGELPDTPDIRGTDALRDADTPSGDVSPVEPAASATPMAADVASPRADVTFPTAETVTTQEANPEANGAGDATPQAEASVSTDADTISSEIEAPQAEMSSAFAAETHIGDPTDAPLPTDDTAPFANDPTAAGSVTDEMSDMPVSGESGEVVSALAEATSAEVADASPAEPEYPADVTPAADTPTPADESPTVPIAATAAPPETTSASALESASEQESAPTGIQVEESGEQAPAEVSDLGDPDFMRYFATRIHFGN